MTTSSRPLELLARSAVAMRTSLESAAHVRPSRSTPCADWDLGTLISHVSDSVELLITSMSGYPGSPHDPDCRARAQQRVGELQLAVRRATPGRPGVELAALTGAFELTIHAWDITESTGCAMTLPGELLSTLLALAPVVLGNVDRTGLFDPYHSLTSSQGTDLDRLLALFGRQRN